MGSNSAASKPAIPCQRGHSPCQVTASRRGPRLKDMTAGPGAAQGHVILAPAVQGNQEDKQCGGFSSSEGDTGVELPPGAGSDAPVTITSQS